MVKKHSKGPGETAINAVVEQAASAQVIEPTKEKTVGVRGLKGIPTSAKITLLAATNPKRPGCAAEKRFALYETGMTCEQFLTAGGTTPDMAYDAMHGYISVEGYTPPKTFVAKPKKEPKPKAEKKVRVPKEKSEEQKEVEEAIVEELID